MPLPLVVKIWLLVPSPFGKVQVTELVTEAGALKATKPVDPPSLNTRLFGTFPKGWTVRLPIIDVLPAVIVPVVSIEVAPVISEAPFIVPEAIKGLFSVLLLSVALSNSVTTVPVAGNIAFELTPVPPTAVPSTPVTAADCDRSSALKYGAVPSWGTVKLWNGRPAAVATNAPALLPRMTPLAVKLVAPVPPTPTPMVPVLILVAGRFGISAAVNKVPVEIRPLLSTVTFE